MELWRDGRSRVAGIRGFEGADIGRSTAEARRDLDLLAGRLEALSRLCARPEFGDRLVVNEGPFLGDAPAALYTTRLWTDRTRLTLHSSAQMLAQAHIAAGGMASR